MATQQTFAAEPASAQEAVRLHRAQKIFRATRRKATARARTTEKRDHRRHHDLVKTNENADEGAHQGARIEARSARRNQSSSSAADVIADARAEPITTSHKPDGSRCWCRRKISRKRRRVRLRTIAWPTRRDVTMPTRAGVFSSASRKNASVRQPLRTLAPSRFTRWNSASAVSRHDLGKVAIRCEIVTLSPRAPSRRARGDGAP